MKCAHQHANITIKGAALSRTANAIQLVDLHPDNLNLLDEGDDPHSTTQVHEAMSPPTPPPQPPSVTTQTNTNLS